MDKTFLIVSKQNCGEKHFQNTKCSVGESILK